MLFSRRNILSMLAALSFIVEVSAIPIQQKQGVDVVQRANSVKKAAHGRTHTLCGRAPGANGEACASKKSKAPQCSLTSSDAPPTLNRAPTGSFHGEHPLSPHPHGEHPASPPSHGQHPASPHLSGKQPHVRERRALHTFSSRARGKQFLVKDSESGQSVRGRYEDCTIGMGAASVFPIIEFESAKSEKQYVLKAWDDFSEIPQGDHMHRETGALQLLGRLVIVGTITVKDGSVVGTAIVQTRAKGTPWDAHSLPASVKNSKSHLEKLIPSAVSILHQQAQLGWLLNDLHVGNFCLNSSGSKVVDTVDMGEGIFYDPSYAAWNSVSNAPGSFMEFTMDASVIEATLRQKWGVPKKK